MTTFPSTLTDLPEPVRALLRGAIDMHVHASPDPYTARRLDALALAQQAREAGMAGLVLKSHEYPTQPLAWAVGAAVPEVQIWGGVALDHGVGGLNPEAVRVSLAMGARVVWMPTFDAAHWRRFRNIHDARGEGLSVLDPEGRLVPACQAVLDLIAEHDAVLASGHLSTVETVTLFREARARGIRCLVTHASFWVPVDAQRDLAALGVQIEQCMIATLGEGGGQPLETIAAQVREVGPEHVVLSTDLGQAQNPDPPLGLGLWIDRFLAAGFSPDEVQRMVQTNPAALLA